MNFIELAEENVKASLLKKVLKLWVLNCCKWSRKSDFNHCLTGGNSFQRFHRIAVQAEERGFQTSVQCANFIKMKRHFQFV